MSSKDHISTSNIEEGSRGRRERKKRLGNIVLIALNVTAEVGEEEERKRRGREREGERGRGGERTGEEGGKGEEGRERDWVEKERRVGG